MRNIPGALAGFNLFVTLGVLASVGAYLIAALIHNRFLRVISSALQYTLSIPIWANVFTIFSLTNLHDVSWGTKEGNVATLTTAMHVRKSKKAGERSAAAKERAEKLEKFIKRADSGKVDELKPDPLRVRRASTRLHLDIPFTRAELPSDAVPQRVVEPGMVNWAAASGPAGDLRGRRDDGPDPVNRGNGSVPRSFSVTDTSRRMSSSAAMVFGMRANSVSSRALLSDGRTTPTATRDFVTDDSAGVSNRTSLSMKFIGAGPAAPSFVVPFQDGARDVGLDMPIDATMEAAAIVAKRDPRAVARELASRARKEEEAKAEESAREARKAQQLADDRKALTEDFLSFRLRMVVAWLFSQIVVVGLVLALSSDLQVYAEVITGLVIFQIGAKLIGSIAFQVERVVRWACRFFCIRACYRVEQDYGGRTRLICCCRPKDYYRFDDDHELENAFPHSFPGMGVALVQAVAERDAAEEAVESATVGGSAVAVISSNADANQQFRQQANGPSPLRRPSSVPGLQTANGLNRQNSAKIERKSRRFSQNPQHFLYEDTDATDADAERVRRITSQVPFPSPKGYESSATYDTRYFSPAEDELVSDAPQSQRGYESMEHQRESMERRRGSLSPGGYERQRPPPPNMPVYPMVVSSGNRQQSVPGAELRVHTRNSMPSLTSKSASSPSSTEPHRRGQAATEREPSLVVSRAPVVPASPTTADGERMRRGTPAWQDRSFVPASPVFTLPPVHPKNEDDASRVRRSMPSSRDAVAAVPTPQSALPAPLTRSSSMPRLNVEPSGSSLPLQGLSRSKRSSSRLSTSRRRLSSVMEEDDSGPSSSQKAQSVDAARDRGIAVGKPRNNSLGGGSWQLPAVPPATRPLTPSARQIMAESREPGSRAPIILVAEPQASSSVTLSRSSDMDGPATVRRLSRGRLQLEPDQKGSALLTRRATSEGIMSPTAAVPELVSATRRSLPGAKTVPELTSVSRRSLPGEVETSPRDGYTVI